MTKNKITPLYERPSCDNEKSKGRKARLFFSASIENAVFAYEGHLEVIA